MMFGIKIKLRNMDFLPVDNSVKIQKIIVVLVRVVNSRIFTSGGEAGEFYTNVRAERKKNSLSTSHCLNYVKKECIVRDQIRFNVNIPNEHLSNWHDLKEDGVSYPQFSFVEF